MPRGEILGHIDVAQVTLYAFWIFFAGLVFWLRREDRREGYPLEAEVYGRLETPDPVLIPRPKAFLLSDGKTKFAPAANVAYDTEVQSQKREPWPGAPYDPTGNPLTDRVGPGSWVVRDDTTDMTFDGQTRIVPLRVADHFVLHEDGPNPIGMTVFGADRQVAGTVSDVWIDRGESMVRYYEVEVPGGGKKLLPVTFCTSGFLGNAVRTSALLAEQFAGIPGTALPDTVTINEEERIVAYFGAGTLYATPRRAEPML